MKKRIFLIGAAILVLACNVLIQQDDEPGPLPPPPTTAQQPEATPPLVERGGELIGFTEVRLHPKDGNLEVMLAVEAGKAVADGLLPVVEFDADWCPPCLAIRKYLEEKNELMLQAYDGTYIIKLDVDEWGWNNGRVENFAFDGIPVYFKLDGQGKPTGEVIDGGAWNEDIPVNIAPVMDAFFHGG